MYTRVLHIDHLFCYTHWERRRTNLGAKCGHFGTPRHIWTSTSIDGNFGEKTSFFEEAILRRKNSTVEGWWNGDTTRRYTTRNGAKHHWPTVFHQVTFTTIWVCYQSCALKKKCETLGEGLGPLVWSLVLPYFNSEDSQRFTIWKVTRRNVVFYYT